MSPQQRTALLSVFAAGVLVVLKLVTGLLTGSLGLVAEAMHSGTDLVAALLTFFALGVAVRAPDKDHPFGHGKAEHLAAMTEALFLILVSVFIGYLSVSRLVSGGDHGLNPSLAAVGVILVVIVIDAMRATTSLRASRKYHSAALASNALHFGSDLAGSVAVLIGLLLARAGFPEADPIAALLVAGLVISAAVRLIRSNVDVLMDRSPEEADLVVRGAIAEAEPTIDVERVRVREAAGRHFVEVTVGVKADAALGQGHAVADAVEEAVHDALPDSDVVVHVEPRTHTGDLRERVTGAALTVRGVREVHNVSVARVGDRQELSLHLKLPRDISLEEAHAAATAVEEAIRSAVPEVDLVHSHIEPLSEPHEGGRAIGTDAAAAHDRIRAIVEERLGQAPRDVQLRSGDNGLIAFVTIALPAGEPLSTAHEIAMQVERDVLAALPGVEEVVVHTEPH
jgi:cation diffusion facilitator family transporter